jgi:hypothetical protein
MDGLDNTFVGRKSCNSTCCGIGTPQQRCMTERTRSMCGDWSCYMHAEILQSKFVLCPPGFGYDSYRIWEVRRSVCSDSTKLY